MLNEYLYEIIAMIVFLTAIVIYFLTRKFNQEAENILDDLPLKSTKTTDNLDTTQLPTELDEEREEEAFVLQEEEGSFGHLQNNPFEKKPIETAIAEENPVQHIKSSRVKIEVPKHDKIRKENFKEFAGINLLVAEDNIINQKVIEGLLNGSGIHVTMAEDGQIALDILKENSDFDLILMDVHMPRIDGLEATRIIRSKPEYEHIVVIALSGDVSTDDIRIMNEAGMQEHLEKPLRIDMFYDVLYAYTKNKTTNKIEDPSIEIIMTQELNGDKGLAVCGGDEIFYKDILEEFTSTYTNVSTQLLELLKNRDIVKADALLLDFIGIAANIGADTIKVIAADLKEAIKDNEEQSYITILDNFEIHLEKLLKDIAAYK
ncbi:response regulator [Sulfurimonas sp.]|nr:response regulator [Sulfurimonas sp.]